MRILFYCPRSHQGTLVVSDAEWEGGNVVKNCPKCNTVLSQQDMQFEGLDSDLQGERVKLFLKKGPLNYHERQRLRTITKALGHTQVPAALTYEQATLAMMRRYRNEAEE